MLAECKCNRTLRLCNKEKEGDKEVEKDLTFPDFYDEDGEKVNAERIVDFIQKVMDWQKPDETV